MTVIRVKGDKHKYDVLNADCIGCSCLQLGLFQHRGATGASGSRNTGKMSPCCMWRAYRGCPNDREARVSAELAAQRKREGHKVA